ncbi:MAG: methyltransferase domain-containing protein [Leptolyngbyaceae cyanobacterium SL_5_14]|nr:methyltransferase domain-containing protein [Leptolyngbyaceae cyanobacterium SL_5_14]
MSKISREESYLYQLLGLIEGEGCLTVVNPQGQEFQFGEESSSQNFRIFIKNPTTYKHIFAFASLGVGETYMKGWWDEENNNIVDLMGLLFKSGISSKARGQLLFILKVLVQRALTLPLFIQNSKRNVLHHYDIGNDFYRLFLDESLTYSCGYQINSTDTLKEMQLQKYELICQKLDLQPNDNIIDIGCGWGGMLIYAAEKYGVHGTGITLSHEQAKLAEEIIKQKGLSERLKILISDYREIQGQFDKLVSIGMFEHVGKTNFSTFMKKSADLLKPGGVGLLHTIGTIGEVRNDPWIARYIFPGGYLPKLHELTQEMLKAHLTVIHCENLKPHYAETLKRWSVNLQNNKDKILALSEDYDESFIRMWYYYLQACEASFRYNNMQLYQILFFKGKQWTYGKTLSFPSDKICEEAKSLVGFFS